jgi:HlyD family secretion protein
MGDQARTIVNAGSVRPYRTAKQKRQVLVAAAVVVLVAAVGAGAWKLLSPHTKTYTLQSWDSATVATGSLVQSTQASGTVALPVQMSLASPEAGYAAKLYVAEGDTVKKGQVLARLEVPDLKNDLEDLQASLAEAQRSYQKTVATNGVDLDRKVREIAALEAEIVDARADVARVGELVAINGSRQSELETAKKSLATLEGSKTEKELQLAEQRRLNAIDEQSAQAKVRDLEVQVQRLEARIAAATITSPMDGEVLSVASTLGVTGSTISSGASLFTIADPSSAVVELEVDEQYSSLLSLGQPVKLTVGSATLVGHIAAIGKVAAQSSDGLGATVSVKVKPEGSTTSLLLGNTAVGEIDLGTTDNALLLPRGPYLTTGSSKYLYLIEGATARRVAVTFGTATSASVQVLSGVAAGDEVITSGYQNYVEYERIQLVKGE